MIVTRTLPIRIEMMNSVLVTDDDQLLSNASDQLHRGVYISNSDIDQAASTPFRRLTTVATDTKILRDLNR